MPIHHQIWKLGDAPIALSTGRLPSENHLEEMIVRAPEILSAEWMLVGRQLITTHGGRIDLLAIAPDGSLVLIELKRDKTPRDIVAQALDYASWVETLEADQVAEIYRNFSKGRNLKDEFSKRFDVELEDDMLNSSHQIVLVASALDPASERIVGYLNQRDIPINVLFFQTFDHDAGQLLSRAWLLDPRETQAHVAAGSGSKVEKEPWNGEFYVSFGPRSRSWPEALKYGFVSAGGGRWYSQTLELLSPGDRIWVKIPKTGFVGVGRVLERAIPADEFRVKTPTGERPALEILEHATLYRERSKDPEKAEHFVRVAWLDTVPEEKAIDEPGMFGNQNSVCKPVTPKWRHTVERLKHYFPKWDTSDATISDGAPGPQKLAILK